MTSYPTRRGSFQHFRRSFLQDDGARFREVLTDEQIEARQKIRDSNQTLTNAMSDTPRA